MKIAYLHSIGGASGDMILSALLDVGLSQRLLAKELAKLQVSGFRLVATREQRGVLWGTHLEIELTDPRPGSLPLTEQIQIIRKSNLSRVVKDKAVGVLGRLIEAEQVVHGTASIGHELATLDTLIDVVGVVTGLDMLGVEAVYASPLVLGSGSVRTSHGVLPVPAPATLALVAATNAVVCPPSDKFYGELTTPTGAALLTTLASFESPTIRVEQVGYGLGFREIPDYSNALAVWLGQGSRTGASLVLLETNIDDMTPELLAYAQERLIDLGALDVWFTSIGMKKSRPAMLLSVLADQELEGSLVEAMFCETSTLGVRSRLLHRYEAERQVRDVLTSLGPVPVKFKFWRGKQVNASPEYEPCRKLALKYRLPLQEVYRLVHEAILGVSKLDRE